MTLDWTALTCRGWSGGTDTCKRSSLRKRGSDPGMAAAIFRLSRRNREQGKHKVTNSSWKLASMDRGTSCLLPKMVDEGRGESACMAPQGTIGRQAASRPLVVVELDITVDPSLVVWRGLCLCEGLGSGWIVIGRVTSHSADFETD
jgi:hypothetical protein